MGWNRWEGLLHNSKFYNYTLRHNTYKERHKMSYKEDYFTDLITNRSISFIRRTKQAKPDSPFLAVVSHSAPHGPETAAPQYSNAFPNARAPRYVMTSIPFMILFGQKQELGSQKPLMNLDAYAWSNRNQSCLVPVFILFTASGVRLPLAESARAMETRLSSVVLPCLVPRGELGVTSEI